MIIKNSNICPDINDECSEYYGCEVLKHRFGCTKCQANKNQDMIMVKYLDELYDRYCIEFDTWSQRKDMESINRHYQEVQFNK